MSPNKQKSAKLGHRTWSFFLRKKVLAKRAATGGPKGDFYSIGNVVKDEYGALLMIERYQNGKEIENLLYRFLTCLLYTSPSPRDKRQSRMPSSA